jgi:hypothetical protein
LINVSSNDLVDIARSFSYDNLRNEGLSVLLPHIQSIDINDFSIIISIYRYDSEKSIATKYLSTKIGNPKSSKIPIVATEPKSSINESDVSIPVENNHNNKVSNEERIISEKLEVNTQVENKKLNIFVFLENLRKIADNDKLTMIENNINHLDISEVEVRCDDLSKFFTSIEIFNKVCEILAINPDVVLDTEVKLKRNAEKKLENSACIRIGNQTFHKSTFSDGSSTKIIYNSITVIIKRNGDVFNFNISRGHVRGSYKADLDTEVIIIEEINIRGICCRHDDDKLVINI